jgi:hypothetical protein
MSIDLDNIILKLEGIGDVPVIRPPGYRAPSDGPKILLIKYPKQERVYLKWPTTSGQVYHLSITDGELLCGHKGNGQTADKVLALTAWSEQRDYWPQVCGNCITVWYRAGQPGRDDLTLGGQVRSLSALRAEMDEEWKRKRKRKERKLRESLKC